MDMVQVGGNNISMSTGPIIRKRANILQQTFQLFVQAWINEKDELVPTKEIQRKKTTRPLTQ